MPKPMTKERAQKRLNKAWSEAGWPGMSVASQIATACIQSADVMAVGYYDPSHRLPMLWVKVESSNCQKSIWDGAQVALDPKGPWSAVGNRFGLQNFMLRWYGVKAETD